MFTLKKAHHPSLRPSNRRTLIRTLMSRNTLISSFGMGVSSLSGLVAGSLTTVVAINVFAAKGHAFVSGPRADCGQVKD